MWLDKLEQFLAQKSGVTVSDQGILHRYFDIIAGTSTGSILACAVAMGLPAKRITQLYLEKSDLIFRQNSRIRRSVLAGVFKVSFSGPKYRPDGLASALDEIFQKARFKDLAVKPTLITAYNALNRQSVIFKNTEQDHQEFLLRDLCLASSAAPTYFPGHVGTDVDTFTPFLDGGIVANNPVVYAIAEAKEMERLGRAKWSTFIAASLGTGNLKGKITADHCRDWGALQWLNVVIDLLFDGSSNAMDQLATQLLGNDNYFRIQTSLQEGIEAMDNSDPKNLAQLQTFARNYINNGGGRQTLERLADVLVTHTPAGTTTPTKQAAVDEVLDDIGRAENATPGVEVRIAKDLKPKGHGTGSTQKESEEPAN